MSCPTFQVSVGIPVFGLGFTSTNQLLLGGGGGSSRSGVKNKLVSYKIDTRRKDLEEDAVCEFATDEDAPMCLDVHPTKPIAITGVNQSQDDMKKGTNDNCRVFKVHQDRFELEKAIKTVQSQNAQDYQKVVRFSEDGTLVATGTTDGKVNVFKYPSFDPVSTEPFTVSKDDEVLDVDINLEKEKMICVLRDGLKLVNLRGKNVGHIVQTISSSIKNSHFRAFRYGRGYTKDVGFAIINGITKPGSYIIKYDAYSLDQLKVIKVGNKPITAFTLSQDGALLAIASADLSISVLDATSLKTLTRVKDAHGFSITCIAISPDRRLLASASADNTCRIVSLPLQFTTGVSINPLYTLLLACLIAAILLWITTIVDIEPWFILESDQGTSVETPAIITSTIESIAVETPLITLETQEESNNNNRDEL